MVQVQTGISFQVTYGTLLTDAINVIFLSSFPKIDIVTCNKNRGRKIGDGVN
jgi:hypothetical protein